MGIKGQEAVADIREQLDAEYDAIELGLFALVYMLRKTRDLALDAAHFERAANAGIAKEVAQEALVEAHGTLKDVRRQVSDLIEWVGNFRNNSDAVTLREPEITWQAFEAMKRQKLKDEE